MAKYNLGLYKSPRDDRDYLLRSFLGYVALPPEYDRTLEMTPVKSQGSEGACVGFAMVVGVKEYQEQIDYNKYIQLSPRYLYEAAKKISGHAEGTTLKAAVEVASKLGTCEERYWPYKPNDPSGKDTIAEVNALKYRIKSYARITNIEELKRAIIEIGPALIGVNVYKGMISNQAKETGVVPDPSCWDRMNVLGGHALCAVGYMDNSHYFKDGHIKAKNSWGSFGNEGYLYLSYKYIRANMLDAFSSVDIPDNQPWIFTVANLPERKKKELWV